MTEVFATGGGVALVLLGLVDVFAAVLLGRAGGSLIARVLNPALWAVCKGIDKTTGGSGRLMPLAGPIMLITIVVVWVAVLISGFALIYWPMLGTGITASSGSISEGFGTALYFSGFNFSTLGIGDVVPASGAARTLIVIESALGFAIVTLTISYTLSIYGAVNSRDTVALSLLAGSGGTASPAATLAGLCPTGCPSDTSGSSLARMADSMASIVQAHHSYPIARYYWRREPELSTIHIAFHVLDLGAIAKAALAPGEARPLLGSRGLRSSRYAAGLFVADSVQALGLYPSSYQTGVGAEAEWRAHFDESYETLSEQSVSLRVREEAWAIYRSERVQWDRHLRALAEHMGYAYQNIVRPLPAMKGWGEARASVVPAPDSSTEHLVNKLRSGPSACLGESVSVFRRLVREGPR